MNIAHYSKAIVALIWAAILVWNTLRPEQPVAAGEADVEQWVNMALAVIGPVMVYLVPNRT